jgi:transposase
MRRTLRKIRCHEVDKETGRVHFVSKEVVKTTLTDDERLSLATDIVSGRTTAEAVRQQYGIVSINSVYSWIGKYMSQIKSVSLQDEPNYDDMANKSKDDQIKELKAALKKAQKEAELEKLRAHAYDKMIDLAEQHFNIPIRKKSGTKQ